MNVSAEDNNALLQQSSSQDDGNNRSVEDSLYNNGESEVRRIDRLQQRYMRILHRALSPLTGADESRHAICLGWFTLAVFGIFLGSVLPSDTTILNRGYRWFNNSIGYTYFTFWSVSFYPQLWTNYRRQTTVGLSVDFSALNVVGFTCYSIYVCALYFSSTVQGLYHEKYGPNAHISVQSNDVAFAVHALILSTCTLGQIAYYDGLMQAHGPSQSIFYTVLVLLTLMILSPVLVALSANGLLPWRLTWLDYLYVLSFLKIGVSLIKYIPQVVLNYHRKSTLGWSIWQILLDFSGGLLSDMQLVGDCWSIGDWSGITGNLAKLLLGFVSITFDTIFMLQHYIWYANEEDSLPTESLLTASLIEDQILL